MATVHLLTGADEILLAAARTDLVADLVGADDPTLLVTELDGPDYELRELVDAAQTLPFLTDRRVVVGRGLNRFAAAELTPLVEYLADPLPTTVLVLEYGGGRVPKALSEALAAAGADTLATGPGRKVADWVTAAIADAGLRPDRGASARIVDWVGDDAGKLPGLLRVLDAAHGPGARLSVDDVEPFLGDAGGVPPWDLTDAIDRGDIPGAITAVQRMMTAGRHPLQVMATLHTHFARMLRLDGANVAGEKEAAALLGLKGSTFPAKKALGQARRLGSPAVRECIVLLARADLDLRGQVAWPDHLVMEVLVARLARIARANR